MKNGRHAFLIRLLRYMPFIVLGVAAIVAVYHIYAYW